MAQQTFIIDGDVDTRITIVEDNGELVFTVEVLETDGQIGDLRGLFFDFNDESLTGLSVDGADVTDQKFDPNKVDNLGNGANMKGHLTKRGNAFDGGVEFGTQGIGKDDIQTTTFRLSADQDLDLSLFEGARFGVRYTSVGEEDGPREDSLKIADINDAPAPSPDSFFVEYGDNATVDVAANDGAFADPSTIVIDGSTVDLGTATVVAGQVEYDANDILYDTTDDSASDDFDYTIGNGSGDTGQTTATANVIDPLRETDDDSEMAPNGQDLELSLSTEDRTYNDSSFVEVGISTGALGDQNVNISFVIDGSGSISAGEWDEQVEAVQNTIDALRAEFAGSSATISVQLVQFSGSALAPSASYDLSHAALDDITSGTPLASQLGGATNYEAGLDQAVAFFTGKGGEDNFLLFTSDGQPNQPSSSSAHYDDEVAALNSLGVSITAVGFGSANTGVLDGIDNTGGSEVVQSAEDLGDVFAASPLFAADLIDFSLETSSNGSPFVEIFDENDLTDEGGGNFSLDDVLTALLNDLGDTTDVRATAVFDTDNDLTTTDDQVTLTAETQINGTDGTDIVFA